MGSPSIPSIELRNADSRLAMRISLAVGVLMFVFKVVGYWLTGSAAILSDAIESIVHVFAVAFAAFSLWLSQRPASARFQYGYERISYFSAGWEGGMIIIAALGIIAAAVDKWRRGLDLQSVGLGILIVAGAGALNGLLGWYLIRQGRKAHSIILEANGKHVLTDCYTSAGVILGLFLVKLTGWKPFDPLCAIAVAVNIMWSGGNLIRRSIQGLMDYADPADEERLRAVLARATKLAGIEYHELRFREAGGRLLVEVHLLFPFDQSLGEAHAIATSVENAIQTAFDRDVEVVSHLESVEDHSRVHRSHR
jgi:cation diffusion facilitator family transporter